KTIPLKKQNPFAPKQPFRLGVVGTSESGKTRIVMSGEKRGHKIPKGGSKNFGERYIPYDNLIVVAQHQDEELWEVVQSPWYEDVRFKLITPEELPDISSFKRTGRSTLIVFDDLASEPLAT
ncbi:9384_t:CDS:2, partial [Gigaspora margarita]